MSEKEESRDSFDYADGKDNHDLASDHLDLLHCRKRGEEPEMRVDLGMAGTVRGGISSPGIPAHLISDNLLRRKRWSICAKHPLGEIYNTIVV